VLSVVSVGRLVSKVTVISVVVAQGHGTDINSVGCACNVNILLASIQNVLPHDDKQFDSLC
jgi:hypothetical protein